MHSQFHPCENGTDSHPPWFSLCEYLHRLLYLAIRFESPTIFPQAFNSSLYLFPDNFMLPQDFNYHLDADYSQIYPRKSTHVFFLICRANGLLLISTWITISTSNTIALDPTVYLPSAPTLHNRFDPFPLFYISEHGFTIQSVMQVAHLIAIFDSLLLHRAFNSSCQLPLHF